MPRLHGACLTIDMGTRRMGWAVSGGDTAHDEIELPGLTSLGKLFGSIRNALCDLIEVHRPRCLVWCAAEFVEHDHVWEAHKATRTIAELVAYDNDVEPQQADQRHARIAVLGRGDFGERGPYGIGLVADSGRRQAKEAVAAWCREQDYGGCGFEVGNALVLRRYCEILGRKKDGKLGADNGGRASARDRLGDHHPRGHAGEAAGQSGAAGRLR